jgi:exodeoxyribonuclease VII small subunit
MSEKYTSYDDVSTRLNEILDEVNAEGVSLDDALALYEEAVQLGLRACDLSEEGAEALLAVEEEAEEPDSTETIADADEQGTDEQGSQG